LQDELFRAFEADLHAVPHVHTVLDAITQPVCVASSGSPQRMRVTLGRTGLYDRFAPNIFSALQVQNGKPAPDLFLFAAGQMKTRPERCVAIEDSIPGVTAACAAGMMVLGFHGASHCPPGHAAMLRAAGAAVTFEDMPIARFDPADRCGYDDDLSLSRRHSGMVRQHQTSDAHLRIGESRDSGFDAGASPRNDGWESWIFVPLGYI
jgi:HAD superfamily hydrolase (TIGR01509 family)